MKHPPEELSSPNEGIPSAEPGEYLMTIANWKEDVPRKGTSSSGTPHLALEDGEPEGEVLSQGRSVCA